MIKVHTADEQCVEFGEGRRYVTDEHNNLEVMTSNTPLGCFAAGFWIRVEVVVNE